MTGQFVPTGNFVARGAGNVDPRLVSILEEAARRSGFQVEAYSGYRPGDSRAHGKGIATDIRIIGQDGQALGNYQDPRYFGEYQLLAQAARQVQMEQFPELDKQFRWGGYFSGGKGKYGAFDLMHFDLMGSDRLGMAGGSWNGGLTPEQASRWGLKPGDVKTFTAGNSSWEKPQMAEFNPFKDGGAMALDKPSGAVALSPGGGPQPFDPFKAGAVPVGQFGMPSVSQMQPVAPVDIKVTPRQSQNVEVVGNTPQMQQPEQQNTGLMDKAIAFGAGAADLPVVGPAVVAAEDYKTAAEVFALDRVRGGSMTFEDALKSVQERRQAAETANPITRTVGNVAGTVAAALPLGATAGGARALGMTGNSLLGRMGMSAGTNALISGADTAARGGDMGDVATSAAIGGAIGGIVPAASEGIRAGGNLLRERVSPVVNALARSPESEAQRRVVNALARDAQMGGLNQIDDAAAAANMQDIRLVDRGGETTRALARSAANNSPEARAVVSDLASTRFETQGDRALGFLYRISGGATDDLSAREAIQNAAKASNAPAYAKAFGSSEAQSVWTPALKDLTGSPAMRAAISGAESRSANRAAVEGGKQVINPFARMADGTLELRTAKDGSRSIPSLQFWDQVKRNLDGMIGKAVRSGDKTLVGDLTSIKSKLVSELDSAVPSYKDARRGAMAFFEAEDALDAGRNFVMQTKDIGKAAAAISKMTPAEKEAFRVGAASRISEVIKSTPDRRNVVNRLFGSKASRDKMMAAFGPEKFREFEAFTNVETTMDTLRGALGNSTTARQLAEMGLAGGAGTGIGYATTGDWRGAAAGALLGAAGRYRESAVAKEVAKLLVSTDPQAAVKATQLALRSPQGMGIIKALGKAAETMVKAAPMMALRPN